MRSGRGAAIWQVVGGVLLFAMAVAMRSPSLVLTPSFWAEEGSRYFAFAYSHGWIDSLLQAPVGYFSLWPNLACAVAANSVSLENAPYVTMAFALVAQAIPVVVVLAGRSDCWASWWNKGLGVTIILFALVSTEVWLNTVNSQFHFSLVAFLILLEPEDISRARRVAYRSLLLLSGLSGPVTLILGPLYLWRYVRTRSTDSLAYAASLATCAVIQVIFVFGNQGNDLAARLTLPSYSTMMEIVATRTAMVYAGIANSMELHGLLSRMPDGPISMMVYQGTLLLAELGFFAFLLYATPMGRRGVLFGSYALLFLLSTVFSAHPDKRQYTNPVAALRYYYVPGVLLLFMNLFSIRNRPMILGRIASGVSLILLISGLYFGITQFHALGSRYSASNPRWGDEVRRWRIDHNHKLAILPQGWEMRLTGRSQKEGD